MSAKPIRLVDLGAWEKAIDEDSYAEVRATVEESDRLSARVKELEAEIAAMTAERDSESRWAEHYMAEASRAREEQREADRRACLDPDDMTAGMWFAAKVRATPLDATPLADRIKEDQRILNNLTHINEQNRERAEKAESELAALRMERDDLQRQATLARELREERNDAMQESASMRKVADDRNDTCVEVARALGLTRAILRRSDIVATAEALRMERDALKSELAMERDSLRFVGERCKAIAAELAALDLLADAYLEDANREKVAQRATIQRAEKTEADLAAVKLSELNAIQRAERMEAAARQVSDCRTLHQGYREGATCLDVVECARLEPAAFAASYREELLLGKHLCERCRVAAALSPEEKP